MDYSFMNLTSSAFENFGDIPVKFTCEGEGITPPLTIEGVTADTKSLVLIVDDPDAPGGLFTHWLLWNISPDTKTIEEDTIPLSAVEGQNSLGEIGFTPPCPPTGIHHYRFLLSALSQPLMLEEAATREEVEAVMEQYVVARAEIVGQYQKKNP